MENNKATLGKQGEEVAQDYYKKNNYSIRETNWRYGHLEIDIIAENVNYIIFCEVKTRSSSYMGNPEEFVTKQKQYNLIKAANNYINKHNLMKEVRFDIISIISKESGFQVHHIPNAFLPRW